MHIIIHNNQTRRGDVSLTLYTNISAVSWHHFITVPKFSGRRAVSTADLIAVTVRSRCHVSRWSTACNQATSAQALIRRFRPTDGSPERVFYRERERHVKLDNMCILGRNDWGQFVSAVSDRRRRVFAVRTWQLHDAQLLISPFDLDCAARTESFRTVNARPPW